MEHEWAGVENSKFGEVVQRHCDGKSEQIMTTLVVVEYYEGVKMMKYVCDEVI